MVRRYTPPTIEQERRKLALDMARLRLEKLKADAPKPRLNPKDISERRAALLGSLRQQEARVRDTERIYSDSLISSTRHSAAPISRNDYK